jgi:intraflagellar transport protein 122
MQGKFDDAAQLFVTLGDFQRAVDMWSDLRQFDKAKSLAQQGGHAGQADTLRAQQAEWSEEVRDYKAAAEMYMESGHVDRGLMLLVRHTTDWAHLLHVARQLDRYD